MISNYVFVLDDNLSVFTSSEDIKNKKVLFIITVIFIQIRCCSSKIDVLVDI